MTYRIKVIEYESGRKEYVPQVRHKWYYDWKYIDEYGKEWHYIQYIVTTQEKAYECILNHKLNQPPKIKSVTYKPVHSHEQRN